MKTSPATGTAFDPDDTALLLEVLELVAHDLGSTAGGLRMRAEALRLGASPDMCESAMRTAASRLARIQHAMRLLMGMQTSGDQPSSSTMPAQNWLDAMAELVPGMLGVGYRLELAEAEDILQTPALSGFSASILAYARAFRGRPRLSGAVHEVHLGARQVGTETLAWLDIPELGEPDAESQYGRENDSETSLLWIQLAERIAARHELSISPSRSHIVWRSPS